MHSVVGERRVVNDDEDVKWKCVFSSVSVQGKCCGFVVVKPVSGSMIAHIVAFRAIYRVVLARAGTLSRRHRWYVVDHSVETVCKRRS